ncbi:MAG TPA: DUF1847 domain-containing protein [Paludibacter sp.]
MNSTSDSILYHAIGIIHSPYKESKENNTELNISMGLCVGHDMVFNQKSAAPVSVLVVKDHAKSMF